MVRGWGGMLGRVLGVVHELLLLIGGLLLTLELLSSPLFHLVSCHTCVGGGAARNTERVVSFHSFYF